MFVVHQGTRLARGLLLACALVGCGELTADGFPASADLDCPNGFRVSNGRCYRKPPAATNSEGGIETTAVSDGGANGRPEAGSTQSDSRDGRTSDVNHNSDAMPKDASAVAALDTAPTTPVPPEMEGSSIAIKVASSTSHDCALMADQTVRCWGENTDGQLGRPKSAPRVRMERALTVPGLREVVDIAVGSEHTCAVTKTGAVLCWGLNSNGQFGNGGFESKWYPDPATPAIGADAVGPIWIAPQGPRTCARTRNGPLGCWGGSMAGGGAWTTAMPYRGLSGVVSLAIGREHSCAVISPGTTICWPDEEGMRPGDPDIIPVPAPLPTNVVGVAVGCCHTCTVTRTGSVQCSADYPPPPPEIADAKAIVAGLDHTCVLRSSGTVWCWGSSNSRGELGRGNDIIGPVSNVTGATALSASPVHTCAVGAKGQIWCWGRNTLGPLPPVPPPPLPVPGTGEL